MSVVQRHVYHYSAKQNFETYVTNFDGIVYCEKLVIDMSRYAELKQSIVGKGNSTDRLTILSLTYFGEQTVSDLGPNVTLLKATP